MLHYSYILIPPYALLPTPSSFTPPPPPPPPNLSSISVGLTNCYSSWSANTIIITPTWTDLPPRVAPLLLQSELPPELVEGEAQLGEAVSPASLQVEEEGPGVPEVSPAGLALVGPQVLLAASPSTSLTPHPSTIPPSPLFPTLTSPLFSTLTSPLFSILTSSGSTAIPMPPSHPSITHASPHP